MKLYSLFKRIILSFSILFALLGKYNLFAQNPAKPDLIYLKDQSVLKSLIVGVNDNEVIYQNYLDKTGKKIKLPVSKIIKIVYANGDVENFDLSVTKPQSKSEVVVLKNQQRIEGKITSADDQEIQIIKKGQTRTSSIRAKDIAQIVYSNGEVEQFGEVIKADSKLPKKKKQGLGMYAGGGVNSASQTLPDGLQSLAKPILAYRGLLGLWYQINRNSALRLEADYTQQGIKLAFEDDYEQLTMNYLKIPILLQGQFSMGKAAIYTHIGTFGGYWLSAKTTSRQNQVKTSNPYTFDQFVNTGVIDNRIEYGICGGAGLSYQIKRKGSLFTEIRCDYGLSDISKYDPQPDEYDRTSNRVVGVMIGYKFQF